MTSSKTYSGPVHGKKTVTTAGTQVQLVSTARRVRGGVYLKPLNSNGGVIYVGNASVSSTDGFELAPGDSGHWFPVSDLADIWIDSASNGEGVSYWGL